MDEMVDRLLDILADKLTERLSAGHKELYTAKELAERYGVSCATIRSKMAAGEFGELVSVGERTRLVPWAGVQAYESTHTGMSTKRTSEKHKAVSHGNPGSDLTNKKAPSRCSRTMPKGAMRRTASRKGCIIVF